MSIDLYPTTPSDRLIVALDVPHPVLAYNMANEISGLCKWVKVGLELFTAGGPEIVQGLRTRGFSVFLDLKLYEIPNSVKGAIAATGQCGASIVTVHASGGPAMLRAAVEGADKVRDGLGILAVTVPTSMDAHELMATGIERDPEQHILHLAKLAASCGTHGLVCSPLECVAIKNSTTISLPLFTPGIRPEEYPADDQSRIATASNAIANGADYLIVGRPVTRNARPADAVRSLLREVGEALKVEV